MSWWTDERDATLRRMMIAGDSFTAIMKELGAALRCAIAGRARRLGLRAPVKPAAKLPRARPRAAPRHAPELRAIPPSKPFNRGEKGNPVGPTPLNEAVDIPATAVRWLDAPAPACKWPLGEPRPITALLVCGAPRVASRLPGSPYCRHHSDLAMARR